MFRSAWLAVGLGLCLRCLLLERTLWAQAPNTPASNSQESTPADEPWSQSIDIEAGRNHWAYRVPIAVEVPKVNNSAWPQGDVDRFVLASLEARGLTPQIDADRRTLLRRLTFDLIGLPPSPAEVEAFVADTSPAAYEAVVARLLASPQFGEKWARHWLDLARYAESTGKTVNFRYPHAWRYRDYVITAFNADKPYDLFIKEQLAGDLIPADDPRIRAERTIATGFLAIGPKTLNERSGLRFELDVVDEQIDVTTQAFLATTVSCARCHDHKFDPIPQADYYALAGIFRSTETCYGTVPYINAQRPTPLLELPADARLAIGAPSLTQAERQRIESQIQNTRSMMRSMRDPVQQFFTMGQIALLRARLEGYNADGTPKLLAMGVRDKSPGPAPVRPRSGRVRGPNEFSYDGTLNIADSPIYDRGEPDKPGAMAVPRGALQVVARTPLTVQEGSSGRLELAEWIASRDNPLTARVMVNRVWLQLFGRGLVPTAEDFGQAGRPPTHPELLDHLAIRFMEEGWSIKRLIQHLVMSRTYQQSSLSNSQGRDIDPDNTQYWRMTPRRLDAEALRDAMLAVSGQLDLTPPVGSVVAEAGEGPVTRFRLARAASAVGNPRNSHRSVYLPVIRDNAVEALALFDAADPALITAHRPRTTVPSQALYLLNNEFVLQTADATATWLLEQDSDADRVQRAYARIFGRPAEAKDLAAAELFVRQYTERLLHEGTPAAQQELEVWSAFCQALLASAEFQYRR